MAENTDQNRDYIRILSHQLKSPINAIQSLLDTIIEGYAGEIDDNSLFLIRKAVARSKEAREIISDLTDLELFSDEKSLDTKELDCLRLVAGVAAAYHEQASENDISIHVDAPSHTALFVQGDARALEHVFRNLVENAVKYTPAGGSVTIVVRVESGGNRLRVDVSDTGSGIPESEQEKVFEPFYRSFAHKSKISGTGLGLAIVRTVTRNHGGSVELHSTEGSGTTFTVRLPLTRSETDAEAGEERKQVVIVGGVTAGPKVAARLRRLDESLDITIVEKGEFLSYSGCGLPWYISGKVTSPRDLMSSGDGTTRDISFFESIENIRTLNNTVAEKIDRTERRLLVRDGATNGTNWIDYDVLVLATGARPIVPQIPGVDQDGVFTLRSLRDAAAIREALSGGVAKDVYIIGGGLVGITTAEELLATGARITILEKKDYVLLRLFDSDIADRIQLGLNKRGVKVRTGVEITGIERHERGLRIHTPDEVFGADLVVISAGVTPNVDLARNAGLDIGTSGGIIVNECLQTTDEAVYAVGDCAESNNIVTGEHEYWPLGSVSTKMGRIAADNINGKELSFPGSIGTAMFRLRDMSVARTGLTSEAAAAHGIETEAAVVTGTDAAHFQEEADYIAFKVVAERSTGRLIGAQAYGQGNVAGRVSAVAVAITHGVTIDDYFKTDLGYSPSFNNPIDLPQTACLVLRNKLDGLLKTVSPYELRAQLGSANIVSVCPASRHNEAAIPGSINIPLERIRYEQLPYDADDTIVLYSNTSSGAYIAGRYLSSQGYKNLLVLEGGFLFWQR